MNVQSGNLNFILHQLKYLQKYNNLPKVSLSMAQFSAFLWGDTWVLGEDSPVRHGDHKASEKLRLTALLRGQRICHLASLAAYVNFLKKKMAVFELNVKSFQY